MSLTASMLTGFTGITSNSMAINTVGNNLANLNTTAFKNQRTLFETLLYQTISEGSAPSDTSGGTNPRQIGMGTTVASIQRNFAQGGFESTGFQSDLAIDGDGLFILESGSGDQVYTRDGAFRLDASQTLVSATGDPLQVFAADAEGNIATDALSNLVIPLGASSEAIPTTEAVMDGRLDSGTSIAAEGAVVVSQPLVTSTGAPATASTALTDLVDDRGMALFAPGDELLVSGTKGGIAVTETTFVVEDTGSTVGDLAAHLEAALGINTDPATGGAPGVTVSDGSESPAGALVIRSNFGEINAVALDSGSITNRTGAVASPFSFDTVSAATGGGVTTSFGVFDSLGNEVPVRLRAVVESRSESGTTWRFYAESTGDTDLSPVLGSGTISFDNAGRFVSATGTDLTIDRAGEGAASPLAFTLDLGGLTCLANPEGTSELVMASQDGRPAGVLTGYSVDEQGIVTTVYSNQYSEVVAQVALAVFPNAEGLLALSENAYTVGPNSGDAAIVAPLTSGSGSIRSGALEQSNVEIAREFVNLVTASTGISSASRVVRVADQLLQELLLLVR